MQTGSTIQLGMLLPDTRTYGLQDTYKVRASTYALRLTTPDHRRDLVRPRLFHGRSSESLLWRAAPWLARGVVRPAGRNNARRVCPAPLHQRRDREPRLALRRLAGQHRVRAAGGLDGVARCAGVFAVDLTDRSLQRQAARHGIPEHCRADDGACRLGEAWLNRQLWLALFSDPNLFAARNSNRNKSLSAIVAAFAGGCIASAMAKRGASVAGGLLLSVGLQLTIALCWLFAADDTSDDEDEED